MDLLIFLIVTYFSTYFCNGQKPDEDNFAPGSKECSLHRNIMSVVNRLAFYANSLISFVHNNSGENFNSIICKFVEDKKIIFHLTIFTMQLDKFMKLTI